MTTPTERAEQIRERLAKSDRDALLELANVHGHGIGYQYRDGERTDGVGLVVYVSKKLPTEELADADLVPAQINGIETDVIEDDTDNPDVGNQVDSDPPGRRSDSHSVLTGGLSGGNASGTKGSIGGLFEHTTDGETVALTNRHIACTDGSDCVGETFIQPSPGNAGTRDIGPVKALGTWDGDAADNVDAGLIDINAGEDTSSYLWAGGSMASPSSQDPDLGERYVNVGRNGLSSAECIAVDVSLTVGYTNADSQSYEDAVRFERDYSDGSQWGGNSGSLWCDFEASGGELTPVALHMSGTDDHSSALPMWKVTGELGGLEPLTETSNNDGQAGDPFFEAAVTDIRASSTDDSVVVEYLASNSANGTDNVEVRILDGTGTQIASRTHNIASGTTVIDEFDVDRANNDGEMTLEAYNLDANRLDYAQTVYADVLLDPVLATNAATEITEVEATLNGEVVDTGGHDSGWVDFDYRETGASEWQLAVVGGTTIFEAAYDTTIDGLNSGTEYEYRLVLDSDEGTRFTGPVETFETAESDPDPAFFDVQIDSTNSPVEEGETLQVDATITNTGDESATQTITLSAGGSQRDSTSVSLGGGSSQSVTLSWATSSGDAGSYTATVSSDDDSDSTAVEVADPDPAFFDVTITSTNSPAVEDGPLEVDVTVTNTGDETATQTVTLDIDSTQEDSTSVSLDGGQSEIVTLTWRTEIGDAGSYTATAASDDASDSTTVEVDEQASGAVVNVWISEVDSPVTETEGMDFTVTAENVGDTEADQIISLSIDGTEIFSWNFIGVPTQLENRYPTWGTEIGDAGIRTATLEGDQDSDTLDVEVLEAEPVFEPEIVFTTNSVEEGSIYYVDYEVTNTGYVAGTKDVRLLIDGVEVDSQGHALNPGETQTGSLEWQTAEGDGGDRTVTLETDDASVQTSVEVIALEPFFDVQITGTNSPVVAGLTTTVDYAVANTGNEAGTQTIELIVPEPTDMGDGSGLETSDSDSETVTLAPDETQTGTLEWSTTSSNIGSRTLTVQSDDDSDTVTVEVLASEPALELADSPSRGWFVGVEHASGTIRTPQVLDGVRFEPAVNDLPRIRIPVPKDEAWLSEGYENARMAVYKNGRKRPIDELEDVVEDPGRHVLVGTGGTQLERRVSADVEQREAHTLAESLIEGNTDLLANVDAPDAETLLDEPLQSAATDSEFEAAVDQDVTDPFSITGDAAPLDQTMWLWDCGDLSDIATTPDRNTVSDDDLVGGAGMPFTDSGHELDLVPFTVDHRIDDVGIALRWWTRNDPVAIEAIVLDEGGTPVGEATFDPLGNSFGPLWDGDQSDFAIEWDGPALEPGEYQLLLEAGNASNDNGTVVDVAGVFDRRYHDPTAFDNTLHEPGGHLDGGITLYPTAADLEFAFDETILSVTAATVDSTWDDTGGQQALALSNDGGISFESAPNTSTFSAEFGERGASVRLRVTAGAWSPSGTRDDATPRTGYAGQTLESFAISANLDDVPLILNERYDDDLADVLTRIADRSDSLWEVRTVGEQLSVEWSQPGQRSGGQTPALSDYTVTKKGKRTLRATVKGAAQSASETHTVGSGLTVDLEHGDLVTGSVRVVDSDSASVYQRRRDYRVRHNDGLLEIRESGSIAGEATVDVDYQYNVSGSFEHDDFVGDPRQDRVETISGLSTPRGCELAAKILVDELAQPRWEAEFVLPADGDLGGLIEALDFEELPGPPESVYRLGVEAGQISGRLGAGDPLRDTIQRIESTLRSTSERV